MKKLFFAVALALISVAGSAQGLKANMDPSVKAGDDFWQYAVGGWLKANPLDKQHAENGAFTDLEELNKKRINELIMMYADKKDLPQGSDGQKIGTLYRLYMDSVGRNKMGYEPILPYLKQVRALKTREELLKLMYEFDSKGFNTAPFGMNLSLNPFKSSEFMMGVGHGGASLAQEYYAEPNESQKKVVEAIKSLNKDYLKMVGYNDADAERMMQAEWAIEHKIGVKTLNQVARRNPMLTIHIMTWEQLLKDFKGIDWVAYRDAMDYPKDIDTVNVSQLEPLHVVEDILANTSIDDLKAYMELHVIKAFSGYLSDAFTDRAFEANKVISGVQEQKPRWKRAVSEISGSLGETVGKLYVKEYFPESSKQRVYRLVKDLQQAFEDRLKENTWMSEETKAKAIEKLHAMYINVGYPDKWEDMEKFVDIRESENLIENYIRINQEATKAVFRKYWRKPVDKTMMACTPQTVNAFYNPMFNSINFPAAILQPPFFDPEADYVSNYGAIGVVIGHEMSHGFDDQGCQFDKDGNLKNWWTADDKTKYDERTKVLADWFSKQEAVPGLKVNGQKTLGENIGDNGGLKIAYRAYENRMKQEPLKKVEGFTPAQRFYLAYARVWASNSTPEYIADIVNSDVHSPNRIRVMAALPMIDSWYKAFGIKKGDKMFVPAEQRAHIW
ncbi:M13 family metallopeptidase [Xylanibacter ruminicola]|uniref:Putative endopeptidase n=1 Tax=Xylanibacter ruminicola TaxID=839 RepID=A0A1M6UT39_XYLRU|nr:M13 family metallopeptidase [Xylanibacter ruminicola]SHK72246.1 putative endopeptidase [Xylanibacter ruminicola]